MKIYPDKYIDKVEQITIEFLRENKIKALILDVDFEQFECYKKEIFRIFIENLKRIFGKPRF